MYVPFEQLPDHARLWIYQSNRSFKEEEQQEISAKLRAFCGQWSAHNQPLNSSYSIAHDQFIILSVDEGIHAASGCSIDSSVTVIREIGQQYQVDLFNRLNQALLIDNKVIVKPLAQVKKELGENGLAEDIKVFNNLVKDIKEFKSQWVIPVASSWLSRYTTVN